MSQIIPIYIPTFISDATYAPSRVLPHIYFYNGLIDCEKYYIETGTLTTVGLTYEQTKFPYFDNYNVVTGSFPTTDSLSLLFNNEGASYGEVPIESLYTTYWEKYISLLYNPKTRLVNCSAIIPLKDYFEMELNDILNFRGNYYHLRAINDYSLKDGTCTLQLLGPIISDTFSNIFPQPTPIPTGSSEFATASINLSEYNASPTAFIDANIIVSGSPYYFSGNFTQSIVGGTIANVTLEGKDVGSTVWGPYTTASATLTTLDNGTLITSSTQYIYSGSGDITITFPTTFTTGHNITISGSTTIIQSGSCCTPTITSASVSGADISIFFTTGSGCLGCTATTIQTSLDGSTWGGSNTAGCGSPRVITAPTASTYYRMYQQCGAVTSSFSNSYYFASASSTATLAWSFSETGGANGFMDIYINGSAVISRSNTSSGTRTVNVGDTINVEVNCNTCNSPDTYSNAYCTGIINDADCVNNGIANIFTSVYTVASGDIGTTLNLDCFTHCDSFCI
jgi:hypothetical protein